jgi:hypothetical protein
VCTCICVCMEVWLRASMSVYIHACVNAYDSARGCIGLTNDLIGLNVKQVSSSRLLSMTTPATAPQHFVQCSDNCSCGVCARVESAAGVSKSHPTETLQLELNCFGLGVHSIFPWRHWCVRVGHSRTSLALFKQHQRLLLPRRTSMSE